MNAASASPERFCPECGAASPRDAGKCWLCGATFGAAGEVVQAELVGGPPPYAAVEPLFALGVLLSIIVLLVLGAGIALDEPGGLIPFFIVVGPTLTATAIHLARRRAKDKPVTWKHGFVAFWVSGAAVVGSLMMLAVGAVVALFLYCLVTVATNQGF